MPPGVVGQACNRKPGVRSLAVPPDTPNAKVEQQTEGAGRVGAARLGADPKELGGGHGRRGEGGQAVEVGQAEEVV